MALDGADGVDVVGRYRAGAWRLRQQDRIEMLDLAGVRGYDGGVQILEQGSTTGHGGRGHLWRVGDAGNW